MLTMTWPRFLGIATLFYVGVNAVFALLFLACGPDALGGMSYSRMGGPFMRAFFFSVETFATIGYGNVYPIGPAANWLVTIESIISDLRDRAAHRSRVLTLRAADRGAALQRRRRDRAVPWAARASCFASPMREAISSWSSRRRCCSRISTERGAASRSSSSSAPRSCSFR